MSPFDSSYHLFLGFDPKSKSVVGLWDTGYIEFVTTSMARVKHGDLAKKTRDELRVYEARLGARNWLYCFPRVRWPRIHVHGGEWLEMMSGVRTFVDCDRPTGFADYIMQVPKRLLRWPPTVRPDDHFPPRAHRALALAAAVRWEWLCKPESIF